MNALIRQSIIDNVHAFCEKLTDAEMQDLVSYFVYEVNMKDRHEPREVHLRFIDEFFDIKDWLKHLHDVDNAQFFLGASITLRTNLDFIQKVLLSDTFFRYTTLLHKVEDLQDAKPAPKPKAVKQKPQISTADKKTLSEILREFEAMLEYQLEDEESLTKYSDDEVDLIKQKKKQLKFIQNFSL